MGGTSSPPKDNAGMTWIEWYDSLAKPVWTPSPATISVIWAVLYPIIAVRSRTTVGFRSPSIRCRPTSNAAGVTSASHRPDR
jgi:hypothetical protein